MKLPEELKTAGFVFVNLFSLFNYAILGEYVSEIEEDSPITKIFSTGVINIFYLCLIVFIGVRIFAFFIGRDLNDLFLHRSLNPGGMRTKLRVLAILILCEMVFFGSYMFYLLYPFTVIYDNSFFSLLIMICLSHLFNILNLLIIYFIHPDLWGNKFRNEVKEYCERMSRERRVIIDI